MKPTENNEMDLLLRSLARREGARSVSPDRMAEDHSAMHLDADELNSYAEQALPAATRARYTSHLADCAKCRKIVSELTASGASVREHLIEQKASAGFWQKVGALLSPAVLRYAVPAFVLLAFVAVGLVALRQPGQPDFVAQNQPSTLPGAATETRQAESPAEPANSAAVSEDQRSSESRTSAGKGRDNQAKTGERNEPSNRTTPTDSVTVTSEKDATPGKAAGVVAQPSYAPEPAAAPPPAKPQTSTTEARTEDVARQKEETAKRDEPAREQEGARARTDDSQNQVALSKARKAAPAGRTSGEFRPMETRRSDGGGAKKNEDESDTRLVSGRRFRRQEGVWIDTAYQSSTATTNVARGSEQFRALVADEPGIRAIAAQLPGEVVLVWKGRAYRIR